jgi:hypothetical protein
VKAAPALILASAIGLTVILILIGLAGIVFGVFTSALGGDSYLIFAAVGLGVFGCGIAFALKVVMPAWQMTKDDV